MKALVSKTSKLAVVIGEDSFIDFLADNMPAFNKIDVMSIGNSTFKTIDNRGFSTISIQPIDNELSTEQYHLVSHNPYKMDEEEIESLLSKSIKK